MASKGFEVELTHGAEQDIEAITDSVAENGSPEIAGKLLDAILAKVEALEKFPLRGSIPKELAALGIRDYRQLLLKPYRLIYRVDGSKVVVTVIADGRRDLQALLERRLLGH